MRRPNTIVNTASTSSIPKECVFNAITVFMCYSRWHCVQLVLVLVLVLVLELVLMLVAADAGRSARRRSSYTGG